MSDKKFVGLSLVILGFIYGAIRVETVSAGGGTGYAVIAGLLSLGALVALFLDLR
ncbi:hypothetical protein [Vibrio sp. SCSIO 43136]|uniref:hypothetical protein n=1 Tax=Vibrio sp. SCSIO 43136 TaxID=2819101 RepID=UPI0020758CA7|nr:hypothetical protein [Vibrio sp. SCSIO 43136]USD68112.1 hypothetical protein J4N39_18225 [Vibrio sp. SCSIO 43136]